MSGGSLVTKGLVSGGGGNTPSAAASFLPTPEPLPVGTMSLVGETTVIVPTAINVALMVAENITDNLRAQQASDLTLPSLYKRAYLVVNTTDEVAIVRR